MAGKITPPMRLMLDIPAWQSEVLSMPAPMACCGALLMLKMHLWRVGPIPDDDCALARITGATPAEWKKARKALEPLFIVKYGEWQREDWNDELEEAYAAVKRASKAGKKANEARWGKRKSASESDSESDGNRTPNPILNIYSDAQPAQQRQKAPKAPSQGEGFSGQPEFLEDVLVAESALGLVGGGV